MAQASLSRRFPPSSLRNIALYRLVPRFVPQVYRKSYKELTDLRLVQQIPAHQGVVWTMKFSRNGKYLATGV